MPTAFELKSDQALEIRHVIGALPAPEGWASVASVQPGPAGLAVLDAGGARLDLAYDAGFLGG